MANQHKPQDYVAILKWGRQLGSFGYFIAGEQDKAARMGAPIDAIYERDGKWVCVSELPLNHSFRMRYELRDKRLTTATVEEQAQRLSVALDHITGAIGIMVKRPRSKDEHKAWRDEVRSAINSLESTLDQDMDGENEGAA